MQHQFPDPTESLTATSAARPTRSWGDRRGPSLTADGNAEEQAAVPGNGDRLSVCGQVIENAVDVVEWVDAPAPGNRRVPLALPARLTLQAGRYRLAESRR